MKHVKRLIKIALFTAVFFFVIFSVLANIGGSGDALKQGLEQFASERLQRPVSIETLNNMQFFPTVIIDFNNLQVRDPAQPEEPVIELGAVYIAIDFWDMTFSTGRVKDFDVRGLYAQPGLLHDLPMENVSIQRGEGDYLLATGYLGGEEFTHEIALDVVGQGADERFSLRNPERAKALFVGSENAP